MNIAIIGSGGREHAIAWKIAQNVAEENIYVITGNGGTHNNINIDICDFAAIKQFCEQKDIKLIIVGPEVPLVEGIVDYFVDSDIKVFGPDKKGAVLEGSKIWSKKFMQKHGVATADFWLFDDWQTAEQKIEELNGYLVIKYDGLAAGKGVYVCDSVEEAKAGLVELRKKYGETAEYLIEERLTGPEISIIGFTDGKNIQLLSPSQDHKQLLDGDKGPNTGGMGAYCPVPFCTAEILENIKKQIVVPTLQGLQAENIDYIGVIYFGLMLTPKGVKTLEYNARLGDPETEIILPALKSSLLELILACFDGNLANFPLELHDGYFVDVVLASGGYPKKYTKGFEITGLDNLGDEAVSVFHAGTKKENGKIYTNGGRVLNVVAHAETLEQAIEKAYKAVENIHFEGKYCRTDIAQRPKVSIEAKV
ncbi:MAG: phosphoribosylamine--glycine ligase [Chitinophagales bacterium]